jgi:predicted ribosomally synthesized peptide with nif11-like leader
MTRFVFKTSLFRFRGQKFKKLFTTNRRTTMAIADIKAFSEKAKADTELKEKLVACMKLREILNLAKEYGFELDEVELYPPNEPQFTEEQLSEKMAKALLRV